MSYPPNADTTVPNRQWRRYSAPVETVDKLASTTRPCVPSCGSIELLFATALAVILLSLRSALLGSPNAYLPSVSMFCTEQAKPSVYCIVAYRRRKGRFVDRRIKTMSMKQETQ